MDRVAYLTQQREAEQQQAEEARRLADELERQKQAERDRNQAIWDEINRRMAPARPLLHTIDQWNALARQPSTDPVASPLPEATQQFPRRERGDLTLGGGLDKALDVANAGLPYAKQTAELVGRGARYASQALSAVENVPVLGTNQQVGQLSDEDKQKKAEAYGTAVGETVIPQTVWQGALELVPGIGTVPELVKAVKAGAPEAIVALTRAGENLGAREDVQKLLAKLGSERGALTLGEADEVPKIPLPDDVKSVLLKRGVKVKQGAWEVLPPVNRDIITDMAKTSVSNFDRRAILAEGRKKQAAAINEAYARTDLPFAERQALASQGMAGTILPEFEPLRYGPEKVVQLTEQIDQALTDGRISKFQWKTAGDVFDNLMTGGKQLEPAQKRLMGTIFGPEFEAAIPAAKEWSAWREVTGLLGIPQALTSTMDISAVGRQMAPMGWAHPSAYIDAISTIKKAAFSEQGATEVMHGLLSEPWIANAPYDGAEGLSFLDVGGRVADIGGHLAEGEGQFASLNQSLASRTVEMLPWVKPSERAYNVPINVLRGKVYQKYAENMWNAGERDPRMYKAVADVIDHATGWSDFKMGQIAQGLNAFYSPRNFAARFQVLLDPLLKPGSLLKPSARQLAARNLVGFTASNAALLGAMGGTGYLAGKTLGMPNPVHIELDPRSSDWGKGKVGNLRVDMTGGFGSILRLVARLAPLAKGDMPQLKTATGQIRDASVGDLVDTFLRGKMGNIPGIVWDAFGIPGGERYAADFSSVKGWRTAVYNNFTPFFVQDVVEAWREQGALGAAIAAPVSVLGGGINTYASPAADLDDAVRKAFGGQYEHYSDLPVDLKGEFDKSHADLVKAAVDARAQAGFDTFDRITADTKAGLAALAPLRESDPAGYREKVGALVRDQVYRGIQARTDNPLPDRKRTGDNGILDGYYDAVKPATDAVTHDIDFDKFDQAEAAYRDMLTPAQRDRLDAMLGYSTDPVYKELKQAKQTLGNAGYFDRSDEAFTGWTKALNDKPGLAQSIKDELAGVTSPDGLKQAIQQKLQSKGIPVENYTSDPLWKAWSHVYDGKSQHFLATNPEADALAVEWGYQTNVHSAAACTLYKQRTGAHTCPVPN